MRMRAMGATAEAPTPPSNSQTCSQCCPRYHEAVELVGKRWTGAILYVLLHGGRLRFTEIANAVPDLSDRLLSERMKELEAAQASSSATSATARRPRSLTS